MTAPYEDPAVVREFLLGRQGPYADPREALDPLDNLAVWVRELDAEAAALLGVALVELLGDPDPEVATGAALGLGVVHAAAGAVVARHVLDAIDRLGAALDRPPVGFRSATGPTILAEVALAAARSARPGDEALVGRLLDERPGGISAGAIGAAVAPHLPDLLLGGARRWFTAADTGMLVHLPTHQQRLAVAEALRPFGEEAVARVSTAAQLRGWSAEDTEALCAVMRLPGEGSERAANFGT